MKKRALDKTQLLIHTSRIAERLSKFGLTVENCTIKGEIEILDKSDIKPEHKDWVKMIITNYISELKIEVKEQTKS
jgi:hypothetical protein